MITIALGADRQLVRAEVKRKEDNYGTDTMGSF